MYIPKNELDSFEATINNPTLFRISNQYLTSNGQSLVANQSSLVSWKYCQYYFYMMKEALVLITQIAHYSKHSKRPRVWFCQVSRPSCFRKMMNAKISTICTAMAACGLAYVATIPSLSALVTVVQQLLACDACHAKNNPPSASRPLAQNRC